MALTQFRATAAWLVLMLPNPTKLKMDQAAYFALDSNGLPWEKRINPHLPAAIFRKVLHTGLLLALPLEQVRDLIGYLMHPVQVPLPK